MTVLGILLVLVAGILLFLTLSSLYSTTMTAYQSHIARWALVIGAIAVVLGIAGLVILL